MFFSFDDLLKYIGIISIFLGIFWSLHKVYEQFIKPRKKRTKYHKLYEMIEDWFDEIDKNLESGVNYSSLNNKEKKISQYIIDNKMENDKLRFGRKFRAKFLKFCGIKKQHLNDKEMFYKYARLNDDWTYLQDYINMLFGAFSTFSANYNAKSKETNFADIEMRVKLLKHYWNYKRQ